MKLAISIVLSFVFALTLLAQGPQGGGPRGRQNAGQQTLQVPQPSRAMTTTLPAQSVTVTFELTSDQATAIEKDRRDKFHPSTDAKTGVTALVPDNDDIASQLKSRIEATYLKQITRTYNAKVQAAQDAINKAQAEAAKVVADQAAAEAAAAASASDKK